MDHSVPPAIPDPKQVEVNLPKRAPHPYFKKLYLPFLSVVVLAIGLAVGVPLLKRITRLLTPASVSMVDLSFSPSQTTVNRGQQFTVNVLVDAKTHQVSAATMAATFSTNHFNLVSITPGPFLTANIPSGYSTPFVSTSTTPTGIASIIVGVACPQVVPTPNPTTTPCTVRSGNGILATLTLQVKTTAPTGTTQLTFDRSGGRTDVAAIASTASVIGDSNPLTLTIATPPASPTPTAGTDTTPPTTSITAPAPNTMVSGTTNIAATAADNVGVSRVEFLVDGAVKGSDTTAPYSYAWDTTNGGAHPCTGPHTHQLVTKAYDAANNVGTSTTVTVNMNNPPHCATPPPSPTPTPTTSPTPPTTPAGTTLQLSVMFQGITTQRAAKTVAVELRQAATVVWSGNINLTANSSGKYTGTTNIVASSGTYDLYVKGPAHLRKKFSARTITSGTNTIDISSTPLVAGDVQVDNTIQLSDLTALLSVWTQSDTPVTGANVLFDLDANSLISLSDITTVISNWTSSVVNGD